MNALCLHQPLAQLMATRFKRVETRSWFTRYRGDIAICSTKAKLGYLFEEIPFAPFIRETECRYGVVLCVLELVDCQPADKFVKTIIGQKEEYFGDYRPGRWAWLFRNFRALKTPVPVKGKQGLWPVPDPLQSQILAAL